MINSKWSQNPTAGSLSPAATLNQQPKAGNNISTITRARTRVRSWRPLLALILGTGLPAFAQTADTTRPTVSSFELDLATATPTSARMIITFSEPVTGVDASDFEVNGTLTAAATLTSVTPGPTAATYYVGFNYTGTSGSLQMAIKSTGTGITDTASNAFVGGGAAATTAYPVNNTPPPDITLPTISSFTAPASVTASPANLTLVFSEAVTGVTATDFQTSSGATIGTITGSGTTWTIPVAFTGTGPVSITLVGGATSNIRDAANHWFAGGSAASTVTFTPTTAGGATAPAITSPLTATVVAGAPFSYTIVGSNVPTALTATGLPAGLTFTSPTISGTIATAGVYNITLGATNAAGSDSETLVVTVTPAGGTATAPAITSPLTATVAAGSAFSYTITGSNAPTAFTATGLPAGLSFTSPTISGNIATAGVYNITVGASNAAGADSKTLVLTVTPPGGTATVPAITSPLTATVVAGAPFAYTITGTNAPTSFTATGLPTGLTITGPSITGTVATAGVYNITLRATNAAGSDTETLVLTVTAPGGSIGGKGPVTVIKRGDGLVPGKPFTLPAMTASGQPITWVLVSGNATLNGNVLTPKNKGAVVVRAFTAGGSPASGTPVAEYEIETDDDDDDDKGDKGNKKGDKPAHRDRLSNLSSRLRISDTETNRAAIAGFVVTGVAPKQMLVRAIGPSLAAMGINNAAPGATLKLHDQSGAVIAQNDGWKGDAAIAAACERVGAFKLASNSPDSALLVTLAPGAYTAQIGAKGNGIALLEVYDAASSTTASTEQLINISTRGYVDSGEGNLIAGFVITGDAPKRVLIRGIGASLASFGVADALADPVLEVYTSGGTTLVARNDNWETGQAATNTTTANSATEMVAAMKATGAFPLASGTKDAALLITLMPGNYSAVVSGANRTTGAGLVEVYEVPNP